MKFIVGLGNPGPKYRNTRHNLGFLVVEHIAGRLGVRLDKAKHDGVYAEAAHGGQKIMLVEPLTYMNLSGNCVAALARNKVESLEDILVIVDDVNLPLGRVRVRADGSAGGHNGLKSLIERLGGSGFPRIRMGVGDKESGVNLADHVLGTFRPEERPVVEQMVQRASDAALAWVAEGIEPVMNKYNT